MLLSYHFAAVLFYNDFLTHNQIYAFERGFHSEPDNWNKTIIPQQCSPLLRSYHLGLYKIALSEN